MVLIATGPIKRDKPAGACQAGQGRREVRGRGHELQGADVVPVRQVDGRAGRASSDWSCRREAAQALVDRVGEDDKRRLHERRRDARAGEDRDLRSRRSARVDVETVEELTASDVEARTYELADALVDGDTALAVSLAEDLRDRGADIMYVLFALLAQGA